MNIVIESFTDYKFIEYSVVLLKGYLGKFPYVDTRNLLCNVNK